MQTTLERYTDNKLFSVYSYNNLLCSIHPVIVSYTEKSWFVEEEITVSKDHFLTPPNYEFMAYVRHHGFPTPLLDWSQSLYVALFFAFENAKEDERVAIYAYAQSLNGGTARRVGCPQINELGPYVATHKRHFI